ncbi:MAG: hypothetical protein JRE45_17700, partial [Deltaproteobacteria bacterium]|nr:hypothetical protein [Deltaproteobacteria bacterium]
FSEAFAAGRLPYYQLEATSACIELARAGHAITLVPRSLAIGACRNGDLKYYEVPKPLRTNDGIHFVRHRSRSSVTQNAIEAILERSRRRNTKTQPGNNPESRVKTAGRAASSVLIPLPRPLNPGD